jgi:exopolysaccharide biosynthesis WecB/TagA/CpsF family protein
VVQGEQEKAIIGSTDSNIKYFTTQIFDRFNFKPSTWRNGFFSDTEYIAYLNKLSTLAPDVVVIGMGTPRQEQFLLDLRATGWNGIGFTCGGFIHQTNLNKGDYYPAILDRLNLRFAYRMWREPSTIKRYLFNYPSSIVLFISGLLSKKISGPR